MNSIGWLLLSIGCIAIQAFYSMVEMAAVSYNRVRLQYYVSKGKKQAIWLQNFLQKPSRLFGTVMLGVNISLQVGSQSAREFYQSLNLDPDLAPITQIFLVVIFAELAPLFAARHYSEHVIRWGIPIVYGTSRLFAPVIGLIGKIIHLIYRLLGKKKEEFDLFISRDELQKALETHEEEDEFNTVITNIFSLRNKIASQIMTPLSKIEVVPAQASVQELRKKISESPQPFFPLFHKTRANIVSIAIPRDLVRLPDNRYVRDYARPPWFITASTKLMDILEQFRRNKQSVAVVLDENGTALGMLTLDAIFEDIFDEHPEAEIKKEARFPLIHRTFPGNTRIADFNREYHTHLQDHGVETLAQLMMILLDHPPEEGDTVVIDHFELIAEETTLLGIKSITITTLES